MLNLWVCDEEGQDGVGKPSIPFEASHDDRWKPYKSSNMYQQAPAQTAAQSVGGVFSYRPQTADRTTNNCPSGDTRQFQQVPVVSIGGSVADTKSRDFDRGSGAGSMFGPSYRNFYNVKQEYQHLKQRQQQGHSYRTAQPSYSTGHFLSNQITSQNNGSINGSNATGSIYGYQQCMNQTNCQNHCESQSNHGNAMLDTSSSNCYNFTTTNASTYDYHYNQNQQTPQVVPTTSSRYSSGEYAASQHPSNCNGSSYDLNTSSQRQIQSKTHYGSYCNIDVEGETQWQVDPAPQQVQATHESTHELDLQRDCEIDLESYHPTGETDQQHTSPSSDTEEIEPDTSFRDMYNNLCLFTKTYGHTNVPRVTSWFLLGKWVETLRKRKRFQILQARGICVASDLQSPLTDHETDLLENIGFNWNATTAEDNEAIIAEMKRVDDSIVQQASSQTRKASSQTVSTPEPIPNEDVQVDMPLDFDIPDDGNLDTMKDLLKDCALLEACPSTIDPSQSCFELSEETSSHESLVNTTSSVAAPSEEKSEQVLPVEVSSSSYSDSETIVEQMWNLQYKRLSEYKRIHGNTAVPARYSDDPKLGHWVMTQRRQYQLLTKGKSSRMTKERVDLLDQLGFKWFIRTDPKTMWNTRLKELRDYKLEHGDCLVPQRYANNTKLGIWVNTQRRHYKLLKEGKKSCMTEERLKKLEDIGFNWSKLGAK